MNTRLHPAIFPTMLLAVLLATRSGQAAPVSPVIQSDGTKVTYTDVIPNARHPELLYWFWSNETLQDQRYLRDVRDISQKSRFDLVMMTDRTKGLGSKFHDFKSMHGAFAEVVAESHARGLKIGLQLWAEGYPKLTREDAVACVSEGDVTLDSQGRAAYSATSRWIREGGSDATTGRHEPIASEPLKAFAFHKISDGVFEPGSLVELPSSALKVTRSAPDSIQLEIDGTAKLAGSTVYVLAAHYHQFPDLFNSVMTTHLLETLRRYRDVPFDGTALDEFGWPMLKQRQPDNAPFRARFYGKAFAKEFQRLKGRSLESELFRMRYSPPGDPSGRIQAINDYFDVLRQAPLRTERAFYAASKEYFGPKTFAGIHNTFHNGLETDEVWRTGLNWWRNPRDYGQSDENISLPVRMGLLVCNSEPVMYDQYYSPDISRYTKKVMAEARYNLRTHYHAWNDTGRWGKNMRDPESFAVLNPLEDKVRLLNQFDPAAPKLQVLIVFGMPAQINWFPDAASRNAWDINTLGIETKAVAVWNAEFPCALVPSDMIDDGRISIDSSGRPMIGHHSFAAMIYLHPQYATSGTLDFLERFESAGGRLMLEGEAARDFGGNDVSKRFAAIAAKATVRGFDVGKITALGITSLGTSGAAEMEDGAVIFSDWDSLATGKPKPFEITLGGHVWSGGYVGVFALKSDSSGKIDKLAAGGFSQLRCDGKVRCSLSSPSDLVLLREANGTYQATIKGTPATVRLAVD